MAYIPGGRFARPYRNRERELMDLELAIHRRLSEYFHKATPTRISFFLYNILNKASADGLLLPRNQAEETQPKQ